MLNIDCCENKKVIERKKYIKEKIETYQKRIKEEMDRSEIPERIDARGYLDLIKEIDTIIFDILYNTYCDAYEKGYEDRGVDVDKK